MLYAACCCLQAKVRQDRIDAREAKEIQREEQKEQRAKDAKQREKEEKKRAKQDIKVRSELKFTTTGMPWCW